MLLLDTHIWLWWLLGYGPINNDQRKELDDMASDKKLAVSVISIWEIELLERKGRIQLFPNLEKWLEIATDPHYLNIYPLNMQVIMAQRKLPKDFHPDPADRIITATSMLADIPLFTHDDRIINAAATQIWGKA